MTTNNCTISQQPTAQSCPLISIIVPAYNCEKYIQQALDSLINQDCPEKNYEIIITDDGSTDSTGKILDDYAARYSFIHVTHTENFGPSHARNTALPQCKGEYITFCDADDFVSPQMISIITRAIEFYGKPDTLVFRHISKSVENDSEMPKLPVYDTDKTDFPEGTLISSDELCVMIVNPDNKVGGFTFNKVIRRDTALSAGFDETLEICEDMDWFLRLFSHNRNLKICIIEYCLYCYVLRKGFGQTRDLKRIYDENGMNRFIISYMREREIKNLPPYAEKMLRGSIYSHAVNDLYRSRIKFSREVNRKLKTYIWKYMLSYYSGPGSVYSKIRIFIKHILILLHIHKKNPRR